MPFKTRRFLQHASVAAESPGIESPLDYSPLMWIDFSDITTLKQGFTSGSTAVSANNDPIGYVLDKSGNSKDVRCFESLESPTYIESGRNGLSIARFDGVGNYLHSVSLGAYTAATLFFAGRKNTVAADFSTRNFLWTHTSHAFQVDHGQINPGIYGYTGALRLTLTTSETNWGLFAVRCHSTTAADWYYNGALIGSNDPSNFFASGSLKICDNPTGGANMDADLGEIILYPQALSDDEVSGVFNYLSGRWS